MIRLNPSHMEILQDLGLVPKPEEPPKKKPGRPKGSKNKAIIKEAENEKLAGIVRVCDVSDRSCRVCNDAANEHLLISC
ncbi:MAG: hypothetical protein K6E30_08000 [Lachnospiraceae bacterium]|nr:hypothetical protein [Lachnospiraceae bacterium]